jgi:pimeloyl-ACP methyl ester carboxylesterase
MSWFWRHISTRFFDYGWAYRLRVNMVRKPHDPNELRQGSKRPILILPGVYETWHFLETAAVRMHAAGHPVHIVPTFGYNLRPIAEMAELARGYIVEADLHDVVIVAHSKGGLIGKTLMLSPEGMARVATMIAINAPFNGSAYAHLFPLRTLREFVPTHETIVALARAAEVNARITSIFSKWDPIIPNGSVLEGAKNLELPVGGHFRILDRADLLNALAEAIETA